MKFEEQQRQLVATVLVMLVIYVQTRLRKYVRQVGRLMPDNCPMNDYYVPQIELLIIFVLPSIPPSAFQRFLRRNFYVHILCCHMYKFFITSIIIIFLSQVSLLFLLLEKFLINIFKLPITLQKREYQ